MSVIWAACVGLLFGHRNVFSSRVVVVVMWFYHWVVVLGSNQSL